MFFGYMHPKSGHPLQEVNISSLSTCEYGKSTQTSVPRPHESICTDLKKSNSLPTARVNCGLRMPFSGGLGEPSHVWRAQSAVSTNGGTIR